MTRLLWILVLVGLGIPALLYMAWIVHCTLDRCYVRHARGWCKRKGLTVLRSRAGMAFDASGLKTEFTIVELECLDDQKKRKLIRLLVWIFGICRVLNDEIYPDAFDEQWPQASG